VDIGGSVLQGGLLVSETVADVLHVGGDVGGTLIGLTETNPLDGTVIAGTGVLERIEIGGSLAQAGRILARFIDTVHLGGAASGPINVGDINSLWAKGSAGSILLDLTENGVQRQVRESPVSAGDVSTTSFQVFYDSTGAIPQAAVRVTSADTTHPVDLRLTSSNNQRFDLARVDAMDASHNPIASGIHDVAVYGDLLAAVSPAAQSFFGLPDSTGGVQLPLDRLGSVAVRENAAAGTVNAASAQAVAFGALTAGGSTVTGDAASQVDAARLLGPGTAIAQANGSFSVPFDDAQDVAFFLATGPGGSFDSQKVLFADQIADNAPVLALVAVAPAGSASAIQTIGLDGNGGSIQTRQVVLSAITSTGPMGDLILGASQGIVADVTAPSIFGNIDATNGPISGVIQTTMGDIGQALTNDGGAIVGTTTLHASGGGIIGKVISRHDLVSQILLNGGMSGAIAAQGDIGAIQRDPSGNAVLDASGHLIRFGGIQVSGGIGGQIVALGNIFGDIASNGIPNGRIAAKGRAVPGLAATRKGILGNININGNIDPGGAIVSAGLIGDQVGGTALNVNNVKGILAAEAGIAFGQTGNLNAASIFNPASGDDARAIDWIFTNGGVDLAFDLVPGSLDLGGLALILTDLRNLRVVNGRLTGTVM
jgi:hypothetical protein